MKKIPFLLALITVNSFSQSLVPLDGERFLLDLKYGSTQNFLRENVYEKFGINRCFLRPEVKARLEKLVPKLKKEKLKVVLWDCYRPLPVQEAMWKLVPDPRYVADPKRGSHHNRGVALDLALTDEVGNLLPFPTDFDDFTPKASSHFQCSKEEAEKCRNRDKLIHFMKWAGLEVFPTEWWHFQLPKPEEYAVIKNFEPTK